MDKKKRQAILDKKRLEIGKEIYESIRDIPGYHLKDAAASFGISKSSAGNYLDLYKKKNGLLKTRRSFKNVKIEALRYLYLYGPCYKSDFTKLLDPQGTHAYNNLSNEIRKKTGSDGFIERQIEAPGSKRSSGQMATVVFLSPAGEAFYKDLDEDRFTGIPPRAPSMLKTTIQLKRYLWPHLADQKTMILYKKAGVKTASYEKPSLGYLFYNLSNNALKFDKEPYDRFYNDRYFKMVGKENGPEKRKEELEVFLKNGAYYSKAEVVAFFKLISKNYTDNIKGVDWHGIFLSKSCLFINFVLSYGNNKRMYARNEYLGNLIEKLKDTIGGITDLYETVYNISDSNDSRYLNSIAAVTIGIGSSHTYSEAMGNKSGKIKNKDMTLMVSENKDKDGKENKGKEKDGNPRKYDIIDCTSQRFERIYSIDDRELGIRMLSFITHYTLEEYHNLEIEMFNEDKNFSIKEGSNLLPAVYSRLNVRAIYLPVYDIKLLKFLSERAKKNVGIVICARREMMETIAHCVHIESIEDTSEQRRVPGLWFVEAQETEDEIKLADSENLISESDGVFSIYDNKGFIKGRKMLDDYYLKRNQKLKSEGEYLKLAKTWYESSSSPKGSLARKKEDNNSSKSKEQNQKDFEIRTRFYNAIARSSVEEVLAGLTPHIGTGSGSNVVLSEIDPKSLEKSPRLSRTISCVLPVNERDELKHLADKCDVAVSPLLRTLVNAATKEVKRISKEKGISEKEALSVVFRDMT